MTGLCWKNSLNIFMTPWCSGQRPWCSSPWASGAAGSGRGALDIFREHLPGMAQETRESRATIVNASIWYKSPSALTVPATFRTRANAGVMPPSERAQARRQASQVSVPAHEQP